MRRLTLRNYIEDDDWAGHAEFLVATHADVLDRREELDDIGYLLARWLPPTETLVPLLVNRLDDPDPWIRRRAVLLLGCVRAVEPKVRALVDDDVAGAAAVWALSRVGVVVPELAVRLDRFPPYGEADTMYVPWLADVLVPLRDNEEQLLPAVLKLLDGAEGSRRFHLLTALYAWDRGSQAPGSTRPRSLMDAHLEHCPLIVEERRDLLAAGRRMSCYAGWKAFAEDEAVRACWKV
ncbi:MAG TPA: hypothetical protein VF821_32120 [Lentzea sp.]